MVMELTKKGIFDAAVLYLSSFASNPQKEEPLKEGVSERHPGKLSTGTIWVYDGRTVLERAINQEVIVKRQGIRDPINVPNLEDLAGLVRATPDADITYFVNTENKTVTPVKGQLRNYDRNEDLYAMGQRLPDDFLSYDGSVPKENVGGRTDTAMLAAKVMNAAPVSDGSEVRVIIAKETPYANTEYGKIAEFGPEGLLYKEFFLKRDPTHTGPFVDETQKLVGVLREYKPSVSGPVELVQESYVSLESGNVNYTPVRALERAA
ncbi:MAG: hypothetical protein WCV90_00210 [Candidatus Woesearchaeota archaeon]